jgi:hypothetical protein
MVTRDDCKPPYPGASLGETPCYFEGEKAKKFLALLASRGGPPLPAQPITPAPPTQQEIIQAVHDATEIIVWMSGASAFSPEGQATRGLGQDPSTASTGWWPWRSACASALRPRLKTIPGSGVGFSGCTTAAT